MAGVSQYVQNYSVDPATRDTTIKRTQVREIYRGSHGPQHGGCGIGRAEEGVGGNDFHLR